MTSNIDNTGDTSIPSEEPAKTPPAVADVVLSGEDFNALFAEAEERGRLSAIERIALLERQVETLTAPSSTMQDFAVDVLAVKDTLHKLDNKVQVLDASLRKVLQQTEGIVAAISKNSQLLTVMKDSAQLGVANLEACPENMQNDHHIALAKQYLTKALVTYNQMRN